MAEELIIQGESKEERYANLLPQVEALLDHESDSIANMANLCACLRDTFHFWWVGFYRVVGNELLLGPFQGPIACTRIKKGRGVCGNAWEKATSVIVPDVEQYPGHIACSSVSRSEIVIPVFKNGQVAALLDIDSEHLNHFDDCDKKYLEKLMALLQDSL